MLDSTDYYGHGMVNAYHAVAPPEEITDLTISEVEDPLNEGSISQDLTGHVVYLRMWIGIRSNQSCIEFAGDGPTLLEL